jgi:hypothetical protein
MKKEHVWKLMKWINGLTEQHKKVSVSIVVDLIYKFLYRGFVFSRPLSILRELRDLRRTTMAMSTKTKQLRMTSS